MKIDRGSIRYKIVVPIFALIAVVAASLLFLVYRISDRIQEDYHRFAAAGYSTEIERILDAAFTELTTARLLENAIVVEAKKKSVIEAITLSWSQSGVEGFIAGPGGNVLASSIDQARLKRLLARPETGPFHFTDDHEHLHGVTTLFPPWEWRITTVIRSASPLLSRKEAALLLPLIALGSLLMASGVFVVLRRNVRRPVRALLADISAGGEIGRTGVSELDTIGAAINDAFGRLRRKTEQYELLHDLAVSIQEILSIDDVLNVILERSSALIRAELAAIALYDDAGRFRKLLTRGVPQEAVRTAPEGRGILKAIQLSITPLRIDDVASHPAFSGSFPEGHPAIRNLLGYPIYAYDGKPIGALYFGNKAGGFTDEDELMLRAISADAAIAITKAEQIGQLKRFKEMIDSAFDIVIVTDAQGLVRYVNPAFETVTGYSRDEAAGRTPDFLRSDVHDEAFHRSVWDTILAGRVWKGEFVNRKKDGGLFHASAVIFPIRTEEGLHFVSIQRDVTQEKKLQEQLLRAQKMEAIGTLAGGIAHDFNNVLAGILGYADIISRQTKEDGQLHKYATIIRQAAERGADLAKKILMVTRKEKMETRPVDLNGVIRGSVDLFQRSMPKNIEIVLNLRKDLPLVKGDPTQMQQVVMNLAVNARDAMPDGGKLIIETAVVGAENGAANGLPADRGGFVKLSVSDTGTGMDAETQRRIFDPFFTTKESGKGTGLGLYIVHAVVSNHGGYINLYSEPGKGTRFSIYLPETKGLSPEIPVAPKDLRGSGTVLVIDDEAHVRELCKDMLEPLGYAVLAAANGEEGVRLFRARKDEIAIVVLDMIMPKMGGSEVFQALRTIKQDVKVLVCSGYSSNGFAGIDALLKNGALGFVQKPFTLEALAGAVKQALSGPR